MSGLRGMVAGFAGLALLEATVSSDQAAGRVGGVFDTAANVLARWLDPYTPLVPDLRKGAANPFGPTSAPGSAPADSQPANATYTTPRRLPTPPPTPTQTTVNA